MPTRRFPPPWSIDESSACFIVSSISRVCENDVDGLLKFDFANQARVVCEALRCKSQSDDS